MSLSGISQENLQSVMGEIELLKNLNHKNIVKYLGSFKTRTHLHIILEYMENGSLASIIKPNKFGAFPESLVAVYIAQVSVHSPQNIELALSARVNRDMGHIQGPSWQTCRAWPSLVQRDVPAMGRAGQGRDWLGFVPGHVSRSKRMDSWAEVLLTVLQVLQGLAYLHDQGVVHRDIKGANILTTKGVSQQLLWPHPMISVPTWLAADWGTLAAAGSGQASRFWCGCKAWRTGGWKRQRPHCR